MISLYYKYIFDESWTTTYRCPAFVSFTNTDILENLERNPPFQITDFRSSNIFKSLRDMGLLVHEGSDKTGYWRIIKNDNE